MNGVIFAFAVSYFIISSKGQCPPNVGYLAVTSCDGSTKNGPYIYIDFYKINRPCYCTVITSFNAESLLALQISLALFVMISTVSTILNIYFYRYIKTRKKFWNGKSNSKGIKDHRSGTATNAETYTELGNTVSGESENQYDSISRQENYINTNVF
uniref:Uncharacterized protein n=1 Tax=Magallana gigas TaxID=29159 RepID=A0A8W8JBS1_MAGGI